VHYFFLFGFFILLGAGCTQPKVQQSYVENMDSLQELKGETYQIVNSTEPQSVQFYMSYGRVGGFGETVLSAPQRTRVTVDGKPLYISSEYTIKILTAGSMPSCVMGTPEIFVDVVIKLVPQTYEQQVGPDDVETIEYFAVEVGEIKAVSIKAQRC